MNRLFHYAFTAIFAGGAALSVVSCSDDDLTNNIGSEGDGGLVRFHVHDVQEQVISRGAMTRGALTLGLDNADLAGQKLTARSNRNINVCLIETTVEGMNPVKADAHTRANIIKTSTLGDFSASAIRGNTATTILTTPEWFHAKKTKRTGELYTPIRWSFEKPFGRFFAVYPNTEAYTKMTINTTATTGSPSVEFEVEPDVTKEVDLMTACSGDVQYAVQFQAPETNLDFRHALTGIRFAVGQNLSWNKIIDKVEIRNAVMKSRYVLPRQFDGTGADWDHSNDTRGTATLSGLSVSTSQAPNVTIMGNTGDNFTFYMIPQQLTGWGVTVYVHCTDGTEITVPLKGEWKAGTTRTYKLSQTMSSWNYVLTTQDPWNAVAYDQTNSQPYSVTSYREDIVTHMRQAVPWKVIGYSVDNGMTWTTTKPTWLTALSKEKGDGDPYTAEQSVATLTKDIIDQQKRRNEELKNAAPCGTTSAPYDLSMHDYKGNLTACNTANSYLISAPGYYRIPLVYGNGIKNGGNNPSSYQTSNTGTNILRNFKDHLDHNITNPWIEKSNSANAGVDGAHIVWADEANVIHLSAAPISHVGSNAYLNFDVKQSNIKSANVVVAVTKGGVVVWSWHLWFAPKSALDIIPVTNYQNKVYNFTKETLGWKPKGITSIYTSPRTVKIKVEQAYGQNGARNISIISITQNPGGNKDGLITCYQWGRKDAFPCLNGVLPEGGITENAGNNMSIKNGIQNPQNFYINGSSWTDTPPAGYSYDNLWSAGNTTTGFNDNNVIKTVYDPCPPGFKMPASNAFTGFSSSGDDGGIVNADGTTDYQQFQNNFGHNFWTNSSHTSTINFPAMGYRDNMSGVMSGIGSVGNYWSAMPSFSPQVCFIGFSTSYVAPVHSGDRSSGHAVRPVAE